MSKKLLIISLILLIVGALLLLIIGLPNNLENYPYLPNFNKYA